MGHEQEEARSWEQRKEPGKGKLVMVLERRAGMGTLETGEGITMYIEVGKEKEKSEVTR